MTEELKKRKTPRLQGYDYSNAGAYFITLCTEKRKCILSRFISTFKRFCNNEYGENIWQARANDHIIRSRQDFEEHLRYIYENPVKWHFDELYADFE